METHGHQDFSPLRGARVLVVEDDPDTRAALVMVLERCGATVIAVGSSRAALAALDSAHPHVLVCDIGLPDEDGYSLMRKVRARDPQHGGKIPAAAVTAYASPEDRRRAIQAGFWEHVPKPVEVPKLLATISTLRRAASLPGH